MIKVVAREVYIICYPEKNQAFNDFEEDFLKPLKNAFYGKTTEKVRNILKIELIWKNNDEENIKTAVKTKLQWNL